MLKDIVFNFDQKLISFFSKIYNPFSRLAIFLVYFWFGLLKILSLSPASPLVLALLNITMPFVPPNSFLIWFGVFEVLIGITFLIPRLERLAILLLVIHLVTTVMPLFIMRSQVWTNMFVPTLEGQYIIKNILIIALAIVIASNLKPWRSRA